MTKSKGPVQVDLNRAELRTLVAALSFWQCNMAGKQVEGLLTVQEMSELFDRLDRMARLAELAQE